MQRRTTDIIVTMQSRIPMRLTALKLLPEKVHALQPAVLRWHASIIIIIIIIIIIVNAWPVD